MTAVVLLTSFTSKYLDQYLHKNSSDQTTKMQVMEISQQIWIAIT